MDDTICAVATSQGVGAISIIRISGPESINIIKKLYKGKNIDQVSTHTINYGHIIEDSKIIDEVLLSVMKKPNTYTGEDIIEINSHGGISTTNKILELLLMNGCRLAEPGEFTKRRFLNGKIDLAQAEAVQDLIESDTENARNLAVNQLTGSLTNKINDLRQILVSLLANIEVNIDFPEYEDAEEITHQILTPKIKEIKEKLEKLYKDSSNSKIIKDGINIAIIGQPNVGKSSILNQFLETNKAIVTDIPGTTRDIVEGSIYLSGVKINFIDTAGIRKTTDFVEKIGVDKSLEQIKIADLVILVLNNNEKLSREDEELIEKIKNKKSIIYINKCDLENKLDYSKLKHVIKGNTINNDGLRELKKEIIRLFELETFKLKDLTYLSNARQIALIKKSIQKINEIEEQIVNQTPIDFLTTDIKICWDLLGEIIGATYKDELLDELFSKFCLGK